MNKQEIVDIVKKIGINKGYRIDYPEDWYKGFTIKELSNNIKREIYKLFNNLNDVVRECFLEYNFIEWKFKHVSYGFWNKTENKLLYLQWIEKENGWSKPEDWYEINQNIFFENFGKTFTVRHSFKDMLNIIYPNYNFDATKFQIITKNHWNDFNVLKDFLLPKCEIAGRMLTCFEISNIKGLSDAIKKHGGVHIVSNKLNVQTSKSFKTLSNNIVKSQYEVIVDNFLYLNNIEFKYENKIIDSENFLYDFKIKNFYIELWGYKSKEYDINRKIKEKIYKENNLKLISLESDIFKNYKLSEINKKLISLFQKNNIKQENFYKKDLSKLIYFSSYNKDTIINELKEVCIKNNFTKLPTREWWFDNGFRKQIKFLENKIKLHELATLFNLDFNEKPKGYWKDFENLKKELLPICKKLNSFPTQQQLIFLRRTDITSAIARHHLNMNNVKIKLNYK